MSELKGNTEESSLVKRALHALESMRGKVAALEQAQREPIAIIGMSCRFPGGANDLQSYWQLLHEGRDAISKVPLERWDSDAFYDPDPDRAGKIYTRWGGFLDQVDQFDPYFFGIAPREAASMDPQQRLLLEVAWEALENSGQVADRLAGSKTGVFIGVSNNDYAWREMADNRHINTYSGTGNAYNVIPGRLSYLLNFQGPSLAVDTACSSSLVAIHLACQSLRNKECNLALAGGVNVILAPQGSIVLSRIHAMAVDGRCKTFDALADGFVRGEGCGVVVLKRLSDAQANGDPILALIRGSAVNQDGRSAGLTAPNVMAQCAVIQEALTNAHLLPEQVSYVETHGSGTPLGDPIEVEALTEVLGPNRRPDQNCVLGVAKTNIGHLEAAAGVAGLIKAVLAMQHEEIPRNLHFKELNPHITLKGTPFIIPIINQSWPRSEEPRYAGVSAFGWAGTNAHVLLEEPPVSHTPLEKGELQPETSRSYLLPLSARSQQALYALAQNYHTWLLGHADLPVYAICASTSLHRDHHDYRLTLVGDAAQTLAEQVQSFLESKLPVESVLPGRRKVVFVLPGQGAQYAGMCQQLLEQEPVFYNQIQRCSEAMLDYVDWSLLDQLREGAEWQDIAIIQPTLFAIQVSLAALWRSWGIHPSAVIGHSMGEVAAACIAGILPLQEGVRIICERSRLLERLRGKGAMLLLELSQAQTQELLWGYEQQVSIAVSNSPHSTVIAGESAILETISQQLTVQNIFWRWIKVDVASHSPQVEPLREELSQRLQGLQRQEEELAFYSTVRGQRIAGQELDAEYWMSNLREPVRFASTIQCMLSDGYDAFIELSPHPLLTSALQELITLNRQEERLATGRECVVVTSLRRGEDERVMLLQALGTLYVHGIVVDWTTLYAQKSQFVVLPTYPFQRERFWSDGKQGSSELILTSLANREGMHPLLPIHTRSSLQPGTQYWDGTVSPMAASYLTDHRVQGIAVLPGTVYLEAAIAVAQRVYPGMIITLEQVQFRHMLALVQEPEEKRHLQLALVETTVDDAAAQGQYMRFQYSSRAYVADLSDVWTLHSSGVLHLSPSNTLVSPDRESLASIQARSLQVYAGATVYTLLEARGMSYGPAFQGIEQLWLGEQEALARVQLPASLERDAAAYWLHPALFDACLHVSIALEQIADVSFDEHNASMPVSIETIRIYQRPGKVVWSYVQLLHKNTTTTTSNIRLLDEEGHVLIDVIGSRVQRLEESLQAQSAPELKDWLYSLNWQHKDLPATADTRQARAGSWWIFADNQGFGAELAMLLETRGEQAMLIFSASMFEQKAPHHFCISPERPADMERLVAALLESDFASCNGIIHLWSINSASNDGLTATSLAVSNMHNCGSVLHLVQTMARTQWGKEAPRLWIVTQGAQSLEIDTVPVTVAQAPLWGFGRGIAQEHPDLWGGLVDLDPGIASHEAAMQLWEHLQALDGEDLVAFRQHQRYVARLERQRLTTQLRATIPWHTNASYLITGGLGDLGLVVAHWMVQQGARRIILMGRSSVPPRKQWHEIPSEHHLYHAVAVIRELEALGASVHLATVDVADQLQLFSFLKAYKEEGWPAIRGVIHAAGVSHDRLLQDLDLDVLHADSQPKVAGGWLLHQAFLGEPLDFFVLFSSASALFSPAFLASYAASNAFLDALAHYRRAQGQVILSINWGFWSQVGMAARRNEETQGVMPRGMSSFTPEQGLEVLNYLLCHDATQVAVMPVLWPEWKQYHPSSVTSPYLSHLINQVDSETGQADVPSATQKITASMLCSLPLHERLPLLITYLQQQVARIFHISLSKLDIQQPLNRMGMDSLMALELKNLIAADLGITFPVVMLLQGPSIAHLATQALDQILLATLAPSEVSPLASDNDYEEIEL